MARRHAAGDVARKKRTKLARQKSDARAKQEHQDLDRLAPDARLRTLRRRVFDPDPPLALRSYAAGASPPTVLVRVGVPDKLGFDALQADLRDALGTRVTQLGAFAVLVRLGRRRRRELLALALRDVTRAAASP